MSTIIKAGEAGQLLKRLSTVDLIDYLDEARQVIYEANRRAAATLADAEREAERLRDKAHRDGYASGVARGEEEGRLLGRDAARAEATTRFDEQHSHVVSDFRRALDELDGIRDEWRETAERELLDLAIRVARKLTFAIGKLHPESALANLRRSLALVSENQRLQIRVHPADLDSIRTYAATALERAEGSSSVVIEPDEDIAPGGCTITGRRTKIDASLETQVDELVSLLVGEQRTDG